MGAEKRASQPPFVLAPAASLIGTGRTEALMLDVELAPENPYLNQLTDTQLPDAEGINPEQRLDAIAGILAIAALRSRYRKAIMPIT